MTKLVTFIQATAPNASTENKMVLSQKSDEKRPTEIIIKKIALHRLQQSTKWEISYLSISISVWSLAAEICSQTCDLKLCISFGTCEKKDDSCCVRNLPYETFRTLRKRVKDWDSPDRSAGCLDRVCHPVHVRTWTPGRRSWGTQCGTYSLQPVNAKATGLG